MRGAFLPVSISNAEFELPDAIAAVAAGRLLDPVDIHQLCTLFRQRGLARMLRDGVVDGWHEAAMQSCGAFVFGLRSWPEPTKVTSFANPLFDAIACGHLPGAHAIAELSRMSCNPDWEYEEDFLYVRFLFEVGLERNLLGGEATLARYAQVLDGPPDARLKVCRALLDGDSEAFDAGLVRLLDERDERVTRLLLADELPDDPARWLAHISIEGLALLSIAARRGLQTAEHYLHCPSIARVPSLYVYDPDAWRSLNPAPRRVI